MHSDIVDIARSYIGTPYHHEMRTKHLGIDCLGLVINVGKDFELVPPEFDVKGYSQNPDGVSLLSGCRKYFGRELTQGELTPGLVVVLKTHGRPCHVGITGDYGKSNLSIIHATNDPAYNKVIETRLMFGRYFNFVTAFEYRNLMNV